MNRRFDYDDQIRIQYESYMRLKQAAPVEIDYEYLPKKLKKHNKPVRSGKHHG